MVTLVSLRWGLFCLFVLSIGCFLFPFCVCVCVLGEKKGGGVFLVTFITGIDKLKNVSLS